MNALTKYALITPARNEAQYIELTLRSVVAQKIPPVKWLIVNDGSTDGTAEIVGKYAARYPWIELLNMPERKERHFAGKAYAVNAGRERLVDMQYDVIGNLDADVSFDEDYFTFMMDKFSQNPRLGCAGTAFLEGGKSYNYELVGTDHVSGMCQLFRRKCFDGIGGYAAVKSGGIDLIAVLSARAKGWETRTFVEKTFIHHRIQGGALHSGLRERLYTGRKDYLMGNHPLWEIFRSGYQMLRSPYIVGGCFVLGAYTWNFIWGTERTLPNELVELRQAEQMKRLTSMVQRRFVFWRPHVQADRNG
jgi:glycosyltransferase involved in cell wall biosynthesis